MKKFLALIISIVLMVTVSVPAFASAVSSPTKPVVKEYTVTFYGVKGKSDGDTSTKKSGSSVTVSADETKGEFDGWSISGTYTTYGKLTDKTITITVKGNITIRAKYKTTSSETSSGTSSATSSSTSSATSSATSSTIAEEKKQTDYNRNGKYDVQVIGGTGVNETGDKAAAWTKNKASITFDADKNQLTAIATETNGTFDNWDIYVVKTDENGKKTYEKATEGVDYSIVADYNAVEEGLTLTQEYNDAKKAYEEVIANINSSTDAQVAAASDNYFNALAKIYNLTKSELLAKLLREKKITIIPLADIVICGNYNGKVTSPKTFDNSIYVALIALFALAGITFSTKKILSK